MCAWITPTGQKELNQVGELKYSVYYVSCFLTTLLFRYTLGEIGHFLSDTLYVLY